MKHPTTPGKSPENSPADIDRLANFVMLTQRSVILGLSEILNKGNVSFPQFFVLAYLTSEEFLTMGDIAKKLGTSTAAATGFADRMEKLKLVERIHSSEDRRKVMVRITGKGVDFVAKMRKEIVAGLETLLTDLETETDQTITETRVALDTLSPKE